VEQIESAKAVCRACEVQAMCLEFALATNQEAGVWGGTSEEERRKLRKSWLARQRIA
jgi:WhiB family redox-sensing transcriptional regulator